MYYTKSHKARLLCQAAILHQLGITFTQKVRSLMRAGIICQDTENISIFLIYATLYSYFCHGHRLCSV